MNHFRDLTSLPIICKQSFVLLFSIGKILVDYVILFFKPKHQLQCEIIFLRQQLANFQARQIRPVQANAMQRLIMAWTSKAFDWRSSLIIVKPDTFVRWHRSAFKRYWTYKSRAGRPPINWTLIKLIRRIARDNPLWSPDRIRRELFAKCGLQLSEMTIAKYIKRLRDPDGKKTQTSQR